MPSSSMPRSSGKHLAANQGVHEVPLGTRDQAISRKHRLRGGASGCLPSRGLREEVSEIIKYEE